MKTWFILLLLQCINCSSRIKKNDLQDPIQFLNFYIDKNNFDQAYRSVKRKLKIKLLLNTRDNHALISRIVKQDLNLLLSSSLLPEILEYIQDTELSDFIYKQILKNGNNQLQNIAKNASRKVLGQLFYYAFKYKNQKILEIMKNRLSNDQINLLFHDIIESWDANARLNVFRNLSKYFTAQKLINCLSIDVLVHLYEYGVQNNDDWIDMLSFQKVQEKITEFMTLGMNMWDQKTVLYFIKQVLARWDSFDDISKINFFYDAMGWDPTLIQQLIL